MSQVTEQEIAAKAVAPRVTKADIDALMQRITYTTVQRPDNTTATFVHAFLDGKFFLASGFSACVDANNFNADIDERLARSNAEKLAENKLWELEGYRLYLKQKADEDDKRVCITPKYRFEQEHRLNQWACAVVNMPEPKVITYGDSKGVAAKNAHDALIAQGYKIIH